MIASKPKPAQLPQHHPRTQIGPSTSDSESRHISVPLVLPPQAAIMARLPRHPNIVRFVRLERNVVGGGGGKAGLVLELCELGPLRDWLAARGGIDSEAALEACVQLAEGLRAVAEAGIVHRDVAAHNVLVAAECPILLKLAGKPVSHPSVWASDPGLSRPDLGPTHAQAFRKLSA